MGKTAMQEFIEQLENNKHLESDWEDFKIKLLEKEKEQILRAFELGMHECLAYDANSIEYYNQTYKQNK
jgi:predicted patatin/cPLA2 family phospholipase